MIRNTKLTGEPPESLIKYIYMKNLVAAINSKVRLLIPLYLRGINPKYATCLMFCENIGEDLNTPYISEHGHKIEGTVKSGTKMGDHSDTTWRG
jgi:hypothetical protein